MDTILRRINIADEDDISELFTDQSVYPYIVDNGPLNREQIKAKIITMSDSTDPVYYGIEYCDNKKLIGFIGVFNCSDPNPTLSYALNTSYHRRSITYNSLVILLEQLAKKYQGVFARTHLDNVPSQNLLRKLDFQYLGIVDWKNGEKRREYYKKL